MQDLRPAVQQRTAGGQGRHRSDAEAAHCAIRFVGQLLQTASMFGLSIRALTVAFRLTGNFFNIHGDVLTRCRLRLQKQQDSGKCCLRRSVEYPPKSPSYSMHCESGSPCCAALPPSRLRFATHAPFHHAFCFPPPVGAGCYPPKGRPTPRGAGCVLPRPADGSPSGAH